MTLAMYRTQPPASAAPSVTSFYHAGPQYEEIPAWEPPSSSPGDPFRPSVELSKPVYEIDTKSPVCTVSGEIELDTSIFRNKQYSVGIAFSVPDMGPNALEWNQDPTYTAYYRQRSYIQMAERLVVDDTCFLKFRIDVPPSLLPMGKSSRVYSVDVRCYALDAPDIATKPVNVQFMILNRSSRSGGRRTSVAA